jgi:hypothetical protein
MYILLILMYLLYEKQWGLLYTINWFVCFSSKNIQLQIYSQKLRLELSKICCLTNQWGRLSSQSRPKSQAVSTAILTSVVCVVHLAPPLMHSC